MVYLSNYIARLFDEVNEKVLETISPTKETKMNFSIAIQIIGYIVENKDTIKGLIFSIQSLIPDAAGGDKANAVKSFIGKALNIEGQLESAWPMVAPIFNLFVAAVKTPVVK